MLGKVAVHISRADREYLSYVKEITTRLHVKPYFVYTGGDCSLLISRTSERELSAINAVLSELFDRFHLLTLSGERTTTRLQEEYDLLFAKHCKPLIGKSMSERLLSETESLRLWVYKEDAKVDVKRVCLPVDFSERSLRQVEFVEALKGFFSFEYHLIYSVNIGRFRGKLSGKDYQKSLSNKEEEVRHMYTDMFGEKGPDLIILEGDPYRDLVRYINSSDCDLVVVGRRGKGMRERVGSVSLHLVRSLRCPVVVL